MKNLKPWVIAHRGSSGEFPENSLLAFRDAIQSHADIIEMDLQLTADGQIVVFHDEFVERIFKRNSGKKIKDYTFSELSKFDIGSWYNPKFKDLRIPTLIEVFENLPDDTSYILELKSKEEELIRSVFHTMKTLKAGLGIGYISVRDIESFEFCNEMSSKHKIGLMQKKRTPEETIDEIIRNEIEIIQIRWRNWKPEDWKKLEELEIIVTAFDANKREEFEFLTHKKVNGILTNYPKQLYEFLYNK